MLRRALCNATVSVEPHTTTTAHTPSNFARAWSPMTSGVGGPHRQFLLIKEMVDVDRLQGLGPPHVCKGLEPGDVRGRRSTSAISSYKRDGRCGPPARPWTLQDLGIDDSDGFTARRVEHRRWLDITGHLVSRTLAALARALHVDVLGCQSHLASCGRAHSPHLVLLCRRGLARTLFTLFHSQHACLDCWLMWTLLHTCTQTHTHARAHTHAYMHTHTHTHTHTHPHPPGLLQTHTHPRIP